MRAEGEGTELAEMCAHLEIQCGPFPEREQLRAFTEDAIKGYVRGCCSGVVGKAAAYSAGISSGHQF